MPSIPKPVATICVPARALNSDGRRVGTQTGTDSPYHRFNPAIPETNLDKSVTALLGSIPVGHWPGLMIGRDECPDGEIYVPALGCCWTFESGAVKAIERLSQGTSNVWKLAWTCDGEDLGQSTHMSHELSPVDQRRPWRVDHPDGGIFVFPLGIDLTIVRGGIKTRISSDSMIGRLLFHPKGKKSFTPGDRSYAVALAFTGFDILSTCMDRAEARGLRAPDYIMADVPEKRLRLFSERFGFQPIGQFGQMVSIIAPTATVRQHASDNHDRGMRLSERARREMK